MESNENIIPEQQEQQEQQEHHEQQEQQPEQPNTSKARDYKTVCAKLGISMCVYFICRLLAGFISSLLVNSGLLTNQTAHNLITSLILIVFVYVIPLLFTAIIFKSFTEYKGKFKVLYEKPKRLARAMGTFPATFGFGHGIALITLLISYLYTRFFGGETYIENLLRPPVMEPSTNIPGVLAMVFMLVIIAPLFEEFLVRGIMYDALKQYGTGIAILISSLLFGLMHGSLYMLFYTTAYGLALGYIRYATGSLFTVTILHMIVNSISAFTLLLGTMQVITNEENRLINTTYMIYMIAVLVMIIVGVAVFLSKIPAIKKYRFENPWTEAGPWKKVGWFFCTIPGIIMMIFAFNELSMGLLTNLLRQ